MATSRLRRRLQQPRLRRQPLQRRLPSTVVVSKAQQVCGDYVVESLRRADEAPLVQAALNSKNGTYLVMHEMQALSHLSRL